jgi:L-amino acid N-acyltransferase YncA
METDINKNIGFREITEKDIPEVLEIYNYYIKNTTITFHTNPMTDEEMKNVVFFTDEKYKTFVILYKNKIAGYVLIYQFKNREAYDGTAEVTIYLRNDLTGLGIGGFALNHIEKYAKEKNIHSLLAIICVENKESIKLFKRNNYKKCAHYKEVGTKFNRYLDVVVYEKLLS